MKISLNCKFGQFKHFGRFRPATNLLLMDDVLWPPLLATATTYRRTLCSFPPLRNVFDGTCLRLNRLMHKKLEYCIYADLLLQSYWYLRLRIAYDVKFLFRLVEHSVHIIFWNYSFCIFFTPKKTYTACFPAIVWDILKLESDPLSYLTKVGGLQPDHPIITPAPDMTIYSLKPCGPCSSHQGLVGDMMTKGIKYWYWFEESPQYQK